MPAVAFELAQRPLERQSQLGRSHDVGEDLQQVLLLVLVPLEAPALTELNRLGEHQLAPRVLEDRAAQALLTLQDHVRESGLGGGHPGAQTGRSGADDRHVEQAGGAGRLRCLAHEGGDLLDRLPPLSNRVADQRQPAELAGDEDARHAGLQAVVQDRHVLAHAHVSQTDLDGVDRARLLAVGDAYAAQPVDDHRGAADHAQDVPLGTGLHAAATARADVGVDVRELAARTIDSQARGLHLGLLRQPPTPAESQVVGQENRQRQGERQRPHDRGVAQQRHLRNDSPG